MFYRFSCSGTFIEADSFEAAKAKYVEMLSAEVEDIENWHDCTCLGLSHRADCPKWVMPH